MKIRKEKTSTKFHRADLTALFHPTQQLKPASATCVTFYLPVLIKVINFRTYIVYLPKWTQMDPDEPK